MQASESWHWTDFSFRGHLPLAVLALKNPPATIVYTIICLLTGHVGTGAPVVYSTYMIREVVTTPN